MIDVPKKNAYDGSLKGIGHGVYNHYCIGCHGPELKGNGIAFPALLNIGGKYKEDQVRKIIENGKNMMPSFKQIPENEKTALLAFLLNATLKEPASPGGRSATAVLIKPGIPDTANKVTGKNILDEVPYSMTGYNRFVDKNGYPGIKPPWGTLNAVDLNNGRLLWKVPLGEFEELKKKGIPTTGTQVYGGPVVTKGGLVFIAGTQDEKIRAFNKNTGKVLWEAKLPGAGYATPAIYAIDGKEFVVIACGGGKIGSRSEDQFVAFALP